MLNVTQLKSLFGSYFMSTGQGNKDVSKAFLVASVTEAAWAPLITTTDTKVRRMKSSLTDVLQPFQKALTPSGALTIAPLERDLTKMKYETDIDPDTIEDSYAGFMALKDVNDRAQWPITRYVAEMMVEKGRENFEVKTIYKGVYLAPTPGTAGAAVDAMDGIGKQIADDITAGDIVPINGPLVWSTDPVDFAAEIEVWIETARDVSPLQREIIDNHCTEIFLDKSLALRAAKGYNKIYDTNYNVTGQDIKKSVYRVDIPFTNLTLVGLPSMSGSKRLVMTPAENRLCRVKRPNSEATCEIEFVGREGTLWSDFWKAVSYWDPEYMYVNQVA